MINKMTFKNISFTYSILEQTSLKGTIILLDGVPSLPEKKSDLTTSLLSLGYDVFFPNYEGSFESKGEFLKRSPVEGIEEFVYSLKSGLNLVDRIYTANKIFLLGSSFGGGIAIILANNPNVTKVCVLSPVLSFKQVKGIETLEQYLKEVYSRQYRFNSDDWQALIDDRFYNPSETLISYPDKILIIAGSEDDQIPPVDIQNYASKADISAIFKKMGHLTLSKVGSDILRDIDQFYTK